MAERVGFGEAVAGASRSPRCSGRNGTRRRAPLKEFIPTRFGVVLRWTGGVHILNLTALLVVAPWLPGAGIQVAVPKGSRSQALHAETPYS